MQDRTSAIELLKRTRDILAERLTERLLDSRDEILEDAVGLAPSSEIDAIYEQLGARLAHVNQMLANLPAEADAEHWAAHATSEEFAEYPLEGIEADNHARDNVFAEETWQWHVDAAELIGVEMLPAPEETLRLAGPLEEEFVEESHVVTWQQFAARMHREDHEGAASVLGLIFEMEPERARRCVQIFADAMQCGQPQLPKAAQLRREVQRGRDVSAMRLLHDCFGLEGMEAASVLQSLKARFGCGV